MRAVRVVRHGEPREVVEVHDIDPPEPGPGQVRVAVAAASLNFGDIARCRGGVAAVLGFLYGLAKAPGGRYVRHGGWGGFGGGGWGGGGFGGGGGGFGGGGWSGGGGISGGGGASGSW